MARSRIFPFYCFNVDTEAHTVLRTALFLDAPVFQYDAILFDFCTNANLVLGAQCGVRSDANLAVEMKGMS